MAKKIKMTEDEVKQIVSDTAKQMAEEMLIRDFKQKIHEYLVLVGADSMSITVKRVRD